MGRRKDLQGAQAIADELMREYDRAQRELRAMTG
jgi:hypothetical protein